MEMVGYSLLQQFVHTKFPVKGGEFAIQTVGLAAQVLTVGSNEQTLGLLAGLLYQGRCTINVSWMQKTADRPIRSAGSFFEYHTTDTATAHKPSLAAWNTAPTVGSAQDSLIQTMLFMLTFSGIRRHFLGCADLNSLIGAMEEILCL